MSEFGKAGAGPILGGDQHQIFNKKRQDELLTESVDLSNDPYFFKNHLGSFQCRLCLTTHPTKASYIAHTHGKRHAREKSYREAREAREAGVYPDSGQSAHKIQPRKTAKIGRPGYRVIKQRDAATDQLSLLFRLAYPQIEEGMQPRHRLMSAYEQKVEPRDDRFQYLLFAAEPYETVAFKVPNMPIDRSFDRFFTHWDREKKQFTLQLFFKAPDEHRGPRRDAASSAAGDAAGAK